jgi:hypothetical protein
MLAFLGGELSNSATYFSAFADVSKNDICNFEGTFGSRASDTWKRLEYSKRVKDAKAVENYKKNLNPNLTVRSKITIFIAKQKSWQEFAPSVGDLIDKSHIEPLHMKNNACALAHRLLLNTVISWSKLFLAFLRIATLSKDHHIVEILRTKCHLQRLAKKIIRWFNETGGKGKEFDYRFTGKDSRLFSQNFMYIIDILESSAKSHQAVLLIHVHAYLCLCLRDAVSLFSRVNITDERVCNLKSLCTHIYQGYCLYLSNVNPTL